MNFSVLTDATWKRVLLAVGASVAIVFSLQAFAATSDIESQKIQLESARGQHCQKWHTKEENDGNRVAECLQWTK